jgi:serine protease Do
MKAPSPAGWICLFALGLAAPPTRGQTPVSLEPPAATAAVLAARAPDDVADLREIQQQTQRVVERVLPATVSVEIGQAAGSGVIVSKDGLVLTAAHVIGRPGRRAWIELPDGRRLRGRSLGADHNADAGMIKLDNPPDDLPFAPISQGPPPELGAWVVTTGQPGGLVSGRTPPVRLGRILYQDDDMICSDCKLVGGDSGGPLFNMRGEVIGIHSSIGPSVTHNFHVPTSAFRTDWDRLLASELWGGRYDRDDDSRAMLGVSGQSLGGRCLITQVADDMPAANAGVKVGDVVTAIDGRDVSSFEQLRNIVSFKQPGDRMTLRIERAGEVLQLRVQLARVDGTVPGENRREPEND